MQCPVTALAPSYYTPTLHDIHSSYHGPIPCHTPRASLTHLEQNTYPKIPGFVREEQITGDGVEEYLSYWHNFGQAIC